MENFIEKLKDASLGNVWGEQSAVNNDYYGGPHCAEQSSY